ncbi:MAG TPA: hypothetical protein VK858_01855 [Longimicrobiales bacterium]|nr:hypothetical protein [Longimicrobiales bacterium]
MIINVNFEEMLALRAGAQAILRDVPGTRVAVAAPPEARELVEALPPLEGDLSVYTYHDLATLRRGVEAILEVLRDEMDRSIVAAHPGAESAVTSYFDYAHALSVLGRLRDSAAEMEAMIELVTGRPPDEDTVRSFVFPD